MQDKFRHNSMTESTQPPDALDGESSAPLAPSGASDSVVQTSPEGGELRGRREFLGKSGKLLIYVPPVIQLFIPTKALAASPSS
ncbi:MAG: hypothetical protein DHS20C16_32900 [Phycisphaerae bacterium]|nr:MAG: hypothetical protein DHS20C16_32900 [Phycisphaerae bacterium]